VERQHQEGLAVAAEHKRMEEMGISGGELLKRPGPDVCCRAIEEESMNGI
jgi:hypothetical protein